MFKSLILKAAVLSLAFGSYTASANTVIDLFSDDQAKIEAGFGAVGPTVSSMDGPNIIGGNRDIEVTADTMVNASAQVVLDQLVIASNAFSLTDSNFNVTVQWDGVANTDGTLDTNGLGAEDLSSLTGFQVDILSSDGSGTFDVTVWSNNGTVVSTITLPFIPVPATTPTSFVVDFGLLLAANPLLDLSSISAIELSIDGSGDTDIRVAAINAIPEPSSLAIMGLALLGFSAMSRRKAKK